jgi:hypothetical protein
MRPFSAVVTCSSSTLLQNFDAADNSIPAGVDLQQTPGPLESLAYSNLYRASPIPSQQKAFPNNKKKYFFSEKPAKHKERRRGRCRNNNHPDRHSLRGLNKSDLLCGTFASFSEVTGVRSRCGYSHPDCGVSCFLRSRRYRVCN